MNPIKILSGLGWILLALGAVGGLYALTASVLVRRFMAATAPAAPDGPTGSPAVSLIKPLHGFEPGLAENLESFCRQAYSGPVQILFGVQSPDDPAIPVVEAVKAAHPDLDITLVVDATPHGANHKVANLINIAAHARHPVLVVSDSDIRV
ncbi:MAG: glycosyltransferase, partial [Caulobacteraceae bacterium]|nr:glycosyltransferase [Caulobacteraceae bacterium]